MIKNFLLKIAVCSPKVMKIKMTQVQNLTLSKELEASSPTQIATIKVRWSRIQNFSKIEDLALIIYRKTRITRCLQCICQHLDTTHRRWIKTLTHYLCHNLSSSVIQTWESRTSHRPSCMPISSSTISTSPSLAPSWTIRKRRRRKSLARRASQLSLKKKVVWTTLGSHVHPRNLNLSLLAIDLAIIVWYLCTIITSPRIMSQRSHLGMKMRRRRLTACQNWRPLSSKLGWKNTGPHCLVTYEIINGFKVRSRVHSLVSQES